MLYDVFISYASEDKEDFVKPLADKLKAEHIEVWYDEFSLSPGDSLRRSIDKGLSKSRYGIVVLSNNFLSKQWPQKELDGLVAREVSEGSNIILPIWRNISFEEIVKYSPTLADKVAIKSNKGINEIVKVLVKKIKPLESPLIIARDKLIEYEINPPVVTDEWWLDVVEASNRLTGWGFVIPDSASWDRWSFPLPSFGSRGKERGEWLAWTAMQMKWTEEAERQKICQMTHPQKVLDFINSQKGLAEICHRHPFFLATYAPQLTIKGFSGEFEEDFDWLLNKSRKKYGKYRKEKSSSGSGLTRNKLSPACDEFIALRHTTFGDYKPLYILNKFVQGEMNGPNPTPDNYQRLDYTVWFFSKDSSWLPKRVHNLFIEGLKETRLTFHSSEIFENDIMTSTLKNSFSKLEIDKISKEVFIELIEKTLNKLNIKDQPNRIFESFREEGLIKDKTKKSQPKHR